MKPIEVAAKRAKAEEENDWEPVEVPIKDPDGETTLLIANPPGGGQIAAFMATAASFNSVTDNIGGTITFLTSLFDDDDRRYIINRLFDRKDPFGPDEIQAIISGLMEEWTGRPTGSPSGSARSQKPGGRKSTRPTPALT